MNRSMVDRLSDQSIDSRSTVKLIDWPSSNGVICWCQLEKSIDSPSIDVKKRRQNVNLGYNKQEVDLIYFINNSYAIGNRCTKYIFGLGLVTKINLSSIGRRLQSIDGRSIFVDSRSKSQIDIDQNLSAVLP